MNLEKVERHQIRKDLYLNGSILPHESITEFDRFMVRQIFFKELSINS